MAFEMGPSAGHMIACSFSYITTSELHFILHESLNINVSTNPSLTDTYLMFDAQHDTVKIYNYLHTLNIV